MVMKSEEFFTQLFFTVTQKIPDTARSAEESRLIKYSLDCQKDGIQDRDAAKNFIGYDSELPSKHKNRDGEFDSKTKLFDSCWAKAQTETRRRVAIAVAKAIFGVDFSAYKKSLPTLMLYCEAVEREMDKVKGTFPKRLAKAFGVKAGIQTEVPIATFEAMLSRITGKEWVENSKVFGDRYRSALSRKLTLRNERIEISAFDDEPDYDSYA